MAGQLCVREEVLENICDLYFQYLFYFFLRFKKKR